MTGKRFLDSKHIPPGFHDFIYVLSKSYWIFLVAAAFFMIAIPFATAGLPGDSIFNVEVTHEQLKFRLIHESVLPVVMAGCTGMGLVCGVCVFQFMQDKKETTIFFSLGMTRLQLFKNRCIAGMLMLFFGIAVPVFVSLELNRAALGVYQGLIRDAVYLTAGLCTVAFVSFFVAAIAAALAGTVAETILYWCGVMAAPSVVCYSLNLLLKTLFWGNPWGVMTYPETEMVRPDLMTEFSWLNPCSFFFSELKLHAQFMRPLTSAVPPEIEPGLLTGWGITAAALLILAMFLMKFRKAEIAGISGTNRYLSGWLIALTSFLVFTGIFSFLYDFEPKLSWLLGIAGVAVVHLFWRKSIFSYGMNRKKTIASFLIQFGVFCVICVTFTTGGFHRAQKFLDSGQIAQAAVSYVGAPGYLYETAGGSSTGRGYYFTSLLEFDSQEDIAQVIEIQKTFLNAGKQAFGTGEEEFSDTVVPYDILFQYMDAEGQKRVWYYDRASLSQLEQLLTLEDTAEGREGQQQLFDGTLETSEQTVWTNEAYQRGTVYITDVFCSQTYELDLTEEQRSELLNAIGQDKAGGSVEERYSPQSRAEAVLMFSQNGEYDCEHYAYNLDNAFVYISEQDTNTCAWLKENYLLELVSGAPEIEHIILQRFDPYIGINGMTYPMGMYFMSYRADTADEFLIQKDFGSKYTITDAGELARLAPLLQNGYFMSDGGFLAAVKIKGADGYVYLFLPEEDIPEFVKG